MQIADKKLAKLTERLKEAQAAQVARLKELYPVGSNIAFNIMSGQVNPSTGIVKGHGSDSHGGYMTVLHSQAKERSRYRYRTVNPSYVRHVIFRGDGK